MLVSCKEGRGLVSRYFQPWEIYDSRDILSSIVEMGLTGRFHRLSPHVIKELMKGRNVLLDRGMVLDGAGAIFIGNPPGRSGHALTYLIEEGSSNLLSGMGGTYERGHHNSIQTMIDEVYEESATTLKIVVRADGHLILNDQLDLTEHPGIILDTFGDRGNRVYRVFVFDVGDSYTTHIFNTEEFKMKRAFLERINAPKKYLEATRTEHITLRSIKKCLDRGGDCDVMSMNRDRGRLRERTKKLFHLLFYNI